MTDFIIQGMRGSCGTLTSGEPRTSDVQDLRKPSKAT